MDTFAHDSLRLNQEMNGKTHRTSSALGDDAADRRSSLQDAAATTLHAGHDPNFIIGDATLINYNLMIKPDLQ